MLEKKNRIAWLAGLAVTVLIIWLLARGDSPVIPPSSAPLVAVLCAFFVIVVGAISKRRKKIL